MTSRSLALGALLSFVLALSLALPSARAADFDAEMAALARGWAHINYEIKDPRAEAAEAHVWAARAEALARQYPARAEPLAWQALIVLCEADARHNLKSLELTGVARRLLERAARIDPNAVGPGSIYANLGSLYAQVPGFPLGFGDPQKARAYFDRALAADPNGLDANFFYADFLYRQGDADGALRALDRALSAPSRPGRELADRGRKWEAAQLLGRIRRKERLIDGPADGLVRAVKP